MDNSFLKIYTVVNKSRKAGRLESIDYLEVEQYLKIIQYEKLYFQIFPTQNGQGTFDIIFSSSKIIVEFLSSLRYSRFNQERNRKMNQILWNIFWYPRCCSENFIDKKYDIINDDELEKLSCLRSSKKNMYPFFMNNTVPQRLFFHVPCSLDCEYTRTISKLNLVLIHKIVTDKQEIQEYISCLKSDFLFWERKIYFI